MFDQFPPGEYRVTSVSHGKATSVEKVPLPYQDIRLGLPCQNWKITGHEFILCGYPYVGLRGDHVVASVERTDNVKWITEPAPLIGAYIIRLKDDPNQVWTVSPERSANPAIVLREFYGREDQFFRFERVGDV